MNPLQRQLKEDMQRIRRRIPNADEQVLTFIIDFATCAAVTEEDYEVIRSTFRAGYCWHFAHLLKTTFGRGEVCWAAPFGHFVWVDTNGIPYDIEGVNCGEQVYCIPESYLGDTFVKDFLHIPGVSHDTTVEEIMSVIHHYEDDRKLPHQDEEIQNLLGL